MIVILAMVLLAGSITLGYVLWIKPIEGRLDARSKAALAFILLTLFGAFWGALPWWLDERATFSWDLPPLASRMLGAAAFAFVVAGLHTLIRPTNDKLRLMLYMIAVYLVPLAIAILAFHLDRFDFSEPVVWGFFSLVVLMCGASLYFLLDPPSVGLEDATTAGTAQGLFNVWFAAVAGVTILWGMALFLTDDGFSNEVWAWPEDLLSSRLIGAMLLTMAVIALYAIVRPSTTTMALSVIATYGLAGALANVWQDFIDKPVKNDYVIVLGAMGLISLTLLLWRLVATREKMPAPITTST